MNGGKREEGGGWCRGSGRAVAKVGRGRRDRGKGAAMKGGRGRRRDEKGLCDGEGGREGGGGERERYRVLSLFADGEEAAASTVRRGKRRSDKRSTEENAAAAAGSRQGTRRSRGRCGEGDSFTTAFRARVRI
ncbi:uncharacterized protein LOC135651475 [Musa acuminata AAA Group]|uniref:uncharacterized protein LOC135651475 n=1 Tax=Musa acuminata AAA Group TaxID=214697 RepID=UPI0031E4335F